MFPAVEKHRVRLFLVLFSAGFFRLLRRFISSRAWAEDGAISSGSSDSSVLSASTVESLVHKRIKAEEEELLSPRDDTDPGTEQQTSPESAEGRRGSSGSTHEAQEPAFRRQQKEPGRGRLQQFESGVDADSDDALPPQMPGGTRDDTKLFSYKLDQLARRKVGAMRRIMQQSAKHNTCKDAASPIEATGTGCCVERSEGDSL